MKKIFKFSILLAICTLFATVSCTHEELSTEQFSDDSVVLSAFAPNPIVRGAELRILGSNLDRIVEVQVPGAEAITDIEVVSTGKISEIRVVVPRDGAEDESVTGPVVIIDNAGNTYTSKAELTFTEGISLDSFEPASAMPGDEVTVKGDYLYNVQQVVLNDGVYITGDQITEKSRRELKFIVPSNAITGPVTIGDVNENDNTAGAVPNNIVSTQTLTIGDPTVTASDRGDIKAGAAITVRGRYLNMIESVNFGGTDAEFTVDENGTSLVAYVPETAVDGDLVCVSYAGKEFNAGAYETVVPTNVSVSPETRYKAGLTAVISGRDLDLVTGAALAGTALEYVYSNGQLSFDIPAAAVDGTIVLTLANGKTVETEAIELVKPVITGVSPLSLYAGDENITVTGTDLDLATSVSLGGRDAQFEYANDVITIITELTSVSGKVALTLDNGVVVESADEVTVNYHSLVIVSEMPTMQHIGQTVTLKGSNFSLVENVFIGEEKVTQYSVRTDTELSFLMPWNKAGMYNLSFHLFNGDIETVATQIEVGLELDITTIWEGSSYINWSGMTDLSWGGYDWSTVKAGTILTVYFDLDTTYDYWQLRFGNGSWGSLPSGLAIESGEGNIPLTAGATYYSLRLTAEDVAMLQSQGGLVMTGTNYTITKITLTTEISQETTVWEGYADPQSYAVNLELGEPDNASWRNVNLTAGQVIKIYFDMVDDSDWSIQAFNAHWTQITFNDVVGQQFNKDNTDPTPGYVSFVVTDTIQSLFTESQGWGQSIILQGRGIIFTQITVQ